jgi:hypothetical protein
MITEKHWQSILPNTLLPFGTPVEVQGKLGKVVKAEMVPAYNGGMICLHTCYFTSRKEVTNLWTKIKRISHPKKQTVNYAFIRAYL